jgi:hypothetical protein
MRAAGFKQCLYPTAACGLKLDEEAIRVAVGLRLGLNLCLYHIAAPVYNG